jgi:drug/metabolite transporter (DMT)-like permease
MGKITVAGVTIEIIGVVLIVAAMFIAAERNPAEAVLSTGGHGTGLGYLPAFLASMLMAAYPRKTAPKAIVNALLVSFVGGGLMILAALMAAPHWTTRSWLSEASPG